MGRKPSAVLGVSMRHVSSLVPYAKNARTHSEAQVAAIAESIRRFGFNSPVLVGKDGVIVAGHGRVMAARKLGLSEVPTIELTHLTPSQARAYVLADNRLTEMGGWDNDLLFGELAELQAHDVDLEFLGFDLAGLDPVDNDAHAAENGPQDDDDQAMEAAPDANEGAPKRNVFPVLVSLNRIQHQAWQTLKRETGLDDSSLFVAKVFE